MDATAALARQLAAAALARLDADRDGDGRLTYREALNAAAAAAVNATAAAKAAALRLLDADGDGHVSVEEAEAGARDAVSAVERRLASVYVALAPYRASLVVGGGLLCCFYGRNFKYTILFARTFGTTGWPALRPALRELQASYARGKRAYYAAAPTLGKSLAEMQGDVSAGADARARLFANRAGAAAVMRDVAGIVAAVEPGKVGDVLHAAYVGLSASFAAVLSVSAAKLGIGMGLGDAVARAVNAAVAPLVEPHLQRLEKAAVAAAERRKASEVDPELVRAWVKALVRVASTALGVYVAHRADDVIYLYAACVAGATLAVERCAAETANAAVVKAPALAAAVEAPRAQQAAICGLAFAGFWHQEVRGRGALPFLFNVPLAPAFVVERILGSVAMSIRAASATA
ncbi:hypothetical protein M885DRAFT_481408 [Pelagophyceae sp. CCMP2097]|nr:hypothetical protein M885DRAFT_481408 [Pelagophyceae sp. CCMP2097]